MTDAQRAAFLAYVEKLETPDPNDTEPVWEVEDLFPARSNP